jgi:hypothetical protein
VSPSKRFYKSREYKHNGLLKKTVSTALGEAGFRTQKEKKPIARDLLMKNKKRRERGEKK